VLTQDDIGSGSSTTTTRRIISVLRRNILFVIGWSYHEGYSWAGLYKFITTAEVQLVPFYARGMDF